MQRTECKHGHDLTDPANVRVSKQPNGRPGARRECIRCGNERARRYQERRRAEQKTE